MTDQNSEVLSLELYLDFDLDASTTYKQLKTRQRAERDNYPEHLSLRVHRALSWLNRAEQCDDDDGRFIFLWIAFNAAYANETGEIRITEGRRVSDFLARLVDLDTNQDLANIVWNNRCFSR